MIVAFTICMLVVGADRCVPIVAAPTYPTMEACNADFARWLMSRDDTEDAEYECIGVPWVKT